MKKLADALLIIGILFIILAFAPVIKDEMWYGYKNIFQQKDEPVSVFGKMLTQDRASVFGQWLFNKSSELTPINSDFSLVIEKIGVNVPVVKDVYTSDENAYKEALKNGVAHAARSEYPSRKPGNVYLFAHASVNFWELGKYATVFNLLRKMEEGDQVKIYYENSEYTYTVINKEVVKGWNTFPLERPTIEPILTLQTCDPPGTTLNRLVVTAKLSEVKELSDPDSI